MIKAQFFRASGVPVGFKVTGHAGYAGKGHDVACASVTSAVQMAANTVTEILGAGAVVETGEALVSLRLTGGSPEAATAILKGLELHLTVLSEQFKGFLSVEDLEVQ